MVLFAVGTQKLTVLVQIELNNLSVVVMTSLLSVYDVSLFIGTNWAPKFRCIHSHYFTVTNMADEDIEMC